MRQTAATKVPFTVENTTRCLCPGCPVQTKSKCVAAKVLSMKDALSSGSLKPEDIPGQYCSTGKATCTGLDPRESCSCFGCLVYAKYNLADGQPSCYYCQQGIPK